MVLDPGICVHWILASGTEAEGERGGRDHVHTIRINIIS